MCPDFVSQQWLDPSLRNRRVLRHQQVAVTGDESNHIRPNFHARAQRRRRPSILGDTVAGQCSELLRRDVRARLTLAAHHYLEDLSCPFQSPFVDSAIDLQTALQKARCVEIFEHGQLAPQFLLLFHEEAFDRRIVETLDGDVVELAFQQRGFVGQRAILPHGRLVEL